MNTSNIPINSLDIVNCVWRFWEVWKREYFVLDKFLYSQCRDGSIDKVWGWEEIGVWMLTWWSIYVGTCFNHKHHHHHQIRYSSLRMERKVFTLQDFHKETAIWSIHFIYINCQYRSWHLLLLYWKWMIDYELGMAGEEME